MTTMGSSRLWGKITVLIAVCGWCLSAQAKYDGGSGTEAEPYRISAVSDWQELMATPADWASHFVLTADIDLNDVPITPVGNNANNFTGVLDGNDYIIRNADINMPGSDYVGLFGYLRTGGQVKNLGVEDASIVGDDLVGGLVGRSDEGAISNCYSTGSVSGNDIVGGFVGRNEGTITNCYSRGAVIGNMIVGGLAGDNYVTINDCNSTGSVSGVEVIGGLVGWNECAISNCYSTGSVIGNSWVGGLVGWAYYGIISDCYSTSSATGDDSVGGLVGENGDYRWGDAPGIILNSYSTGSVSGVHVIGGLAGSSSGTIRNCYSSASVTASDTVGGLVGYNHPVVGSMIVNCYSTGDVSGGNPRGGLVGLGGACEWVCEPVCEEICVWLCDEWSYCWDECWEHCWVECRWVCERGMDSFWDIETSDCNTSSGGTGKTTAEMKTKGTFTDAGWDFVDIWKIDKGVDYPRLMWEESPVGGGYSGGTGVPGDPYRIATGDDLNDIGNYEEWDKCFILVNDVNLTGYTGTQFNIIGNESSPFTGVFDGNDHKIWNFTWESTGVNYVGLFGYIGAGGQIENLGLEKMDVNATNGDIVGGLGGFNNGTITECYAKGSVAGNAHVGGLVGSNNATISESCARVTVSGNNFVGGLVGWNYSGFTTVTITTDTTWRGIGPEGNLSGIPITSVGLAWEAANPGWNSSLTFDDTDPAGWKSCVAPQGLPHIWVDGNTLNGSTPAYYRKVFELPGVSTSGTLGFTVDDDVFIYINGELVVSDTDGVVTIETGVDVTSHLKQGKNLIAVKAHDSYGAYEDIVVSLDIEGDGFGTVNKCYSVGSVSGAGYYGGLVGGNNGTITASFWDTETSDCNTSAGGTPKTTAEMMTQSTFTDVGWDFIGETANGTEDIWAICEGTNYPRFVWQIPTGDIVCPDGVNSFDFAVLARYWHETDCAALDDCEGADIDLSGAVDFGDVAAVAESWLAGL